MEETIERCANPECNQPITFGPAQIKLPKHGREISGFMATCAHCGNAHFDSETIKTLIELGYVARVKDKTSADAGNNGQ